MPSESSRVWRYHGQVQDPPTPAAFITPSHDVAGCPGLSSAARHHRQKPPRTPPCYDFVCQKCHAGYVNPAHFRRHEVTCDGTNRLMCRICMRGFSQMCALKEHMRGFHGLGDQIACRYCGKKFKYKTAVYIHRCPEKEKVLAAKE